MERRGVAAAVIFTIITCGIYGIYWMYKIAQGYYETPTNERVDTTPGVTVLLIIITGGIYGWYCYYKWGRATAEIWGRYGRDDGDKAVMYLLLSIFGFSIICDAMIQSDFNNWLSIWEGGGPAPNQPPHQPPPYQPPPYQPPPPQGPPQY